MKNIFGKLSKNKNERTAMEADQLRDSSKNFFGDLFDVITGKFADIYKRIKKNSNRDLILLSIVLLGFGFRFYAFNWDNGHYLHPDERFMYMTINDIDWPSSVEEYFDQSSPLNTNSKGYVYGTVPLYLTKWVGDVTGYDKYGNIHLVARTTVAFVDALSILLVYAIARNVFKSENVGRASAFIYACMVLPIQASHFFTVDLYQVHFLLWCAFFLARPAPQSNNQKFWLAIVVGIFFGLAVGSKISALYFAPVIALLMVKQINFVVNDRIPNMVKKLIRVALHGFLLIITAYIVFRLTNPYLFATPKLLDFRIEPKIYESYKFYFDASKGAIIFPPSWQWMGRIPALSTLSDLVFWGAGLPIFGLFILGFATTIVKLFKEVRGIAFKFKMAKLFDDRLNIFYWILILFFIISLSFVSTVKYLMPIMPYIAMFAGVGLLFIEKWLAPKIRWIGFVLMLAVLFWPIAFMNIYNNPVTRVTASQWIYANVDPESIILVEDWDDALPINLTSDEHSQSNTVLINFMSRAIGMNLYVPDEESKIEYIFNKISKADYIVLSSNRSRYTVGRIPAKFPYTSRYYKGLDEGTIGFTLVKTVAVYPGIGPLIFNDANAEEALSVYDHPEVHIYKKNKTISLQEFTDWVKAN